jgi:hypothetical protein
MRAIGDAEMIQQQTFYRTNAMNATCECGFTKYYSRLYHTQIPCCHLLRTGLPRPSMRQPPDLQRQPDTTFHLIVDKKERLGEEPSSKRRDALIRMTARSIKQLSKTGAKPDVIEKWVADHFPPPEQMRTFIQNIPTTVLILISSGVLSFRFPGSANEVPEREEE